MDVEICTVGGYNEVGKNCTAIKYGDEVVILDMGFFLPSLINFEEEGGHRKNLTPNGLISLGAIPDDSVIKSWRGKVKAIAATHCHLDHIGGIPYLAGKYDAPVLGTPFTTEVLKGMLRDEDIKMKNDIRVLNAGSFYEVSENIKIEFINMTHSTPHTVMIAVHTPKGVVLYGNDFKFDNHPVVGKKPDYERLKKIQKEGVIGLVVDSLYASARRKTPSEKVAREMLKDVMLGTDSSRNSIIASSFASHIARLKSMIEFGKKLDRDIYIMGRSMAKYIGAAEKVGMVNFSKDAQIFGYSRQIKKQLQKLDKKGRNKAMLIVTGSQGEPGSILSRMASGQLPYRFNPEDHVIFSCKVIPAEANIENRAVLEAKLHKKRTRVFTDIHVSVLPDTEVVFNDSKSMKIKKIEDVKDHKDLRVPAFDPNDLKIKWYDAKLIKHDYSGKIFNIKTKTGRSVSITSGHSVFVLRNGQILDVPGDDLKKGDYVAIPKRFMWDKSLGEIDVLDYINKKESKWSRFSYDKKWIYYAKRKISPRKIKLSKDFAKLLGYYLAEGSAPRHISLTFGSHEEDLINEVCKSIKNTFPSNINLVDRGTAKEVQFGANILKGIFKEWFGNNAREKKIPSFVFSASEEFKLAFLGAYINGDGALEEAERKHCKIRIKTASKKLASDIIYLFSQLGICAKFDHKEIVPARIIAGNKQKSLESISYVVRIQGKNSMLVIKDYLKTKFKDRITKHLKSKILDSQSTTPEALPIEHIDWNEIICKKNTYLRELQCQKRKNHLGIDILKRDSLEIKGKTKKIIDGHLQFDPIVNIEEKNYTGPVYDFSVPEAQNFIGGFGGIMLHNSGHCGREDLRDLINMVKPKHIIPAHGDHTKTEALGDLAVEMGYKLKKDVHIVNNGDKLILK